MKMYSFLTIFTRDFINIVRNPVLFLTNTVFPFLLILVLGYLTNGSYGTEITSFDYYGITILLVSVLNVSITASNSFMERSIKRSNLRILYAPIPSTFVYGSKILATFLFTSLCFLILMAIENLLLGVHLGGERVGLI
jgi:ABC-2 type transport system permease protein